MTCPQCRARIYLTDSRCLACGVALDEGKLVGKAPASLVPFLDGRVRIDVRGGWISLKSPGLRAGVTSIAMGCAGLGLLAYELYLCRHGKQPNENVWALLGFAPIFFVAGVGLILGRRRIVVDPRTRRINFHRRGRRVRSLPFDEVTEVRYGVRREPSESRRGPSEVDVQFVELGTEGEALYLWRRAGQDDGPPAFAQALAEATGARARREPEAPPETAEGAEIPVYSDEQKAEFRRQYRVTKIVLGALKLTMMVAAVATYAGARLLEGRVEVLLGAVLG
ncbi:MAG: hypothetical protein ACE5R4_16305, partial [Armatimonadota bacterium]